MGSSKIGSSSTKEYIEKFLARRSCLDLMFFFQATHNPAKEITESYAMWEAAKLLEPDPKADVVCIVVGDGSTPRTGALVAFSSRWECHSIDPSLNIAGWNKVRSRRVKQGEPIQRLKAYPGYARDVKIDCQGKRTLILLPHSHCDIKEALGVAVNATRIDVISMPCCTEVPHWIMDKKFTLEHNLKVYDDDGVWSPKRRIFIWENMESIK